MAQHNAPQPVVCKVYKNKPIFVLGINRDVAHNSFVLDSDRPTFLRQYLEPILFLLPQFTKTWHNDDIILYILLLYYIIILYDVTSLNKKKEHLLNCL